MNGAHLHLVLNHFPIFSTLFGIVIISWGLLKKLPQVRKVGLVLLILGAMMSYVAIESGEAAEEQIEESSISISHESIHDHEEAAEIAFWFSIIMGGLGIIILVSTNVNIRLEKTLYGVLIITAVLTLLILIFTAYKGGEIRHNIELSNIELFDSNIGF
ncbi:MAG: hypothetical protein U5K72_09555 [Balneolaceae bacterium]|nr:hypothetical protein [Balneolaceae bacterium]